MSIKRGKNIILKAILSIFLFNSFGIIGISYAGGVFDLDNNNNEIIYCKPGDNCDIQKGVDIVKNNLNDVETNKKFSEKVQDMVKYLLYFVGIVGVLYIIYAGFNILVAGGKDENVKKSKTTIVHVIAGIAIMFLAYSIISLIINVLNGGKPTSFLPSFIEQTYAYTSSDKNTFDEYRKGIELLTSQLERDYKVNGKLSPTNLSSLKQLVTNAIDTFPDNNDYIYNSGLGKNLLISIDVVSKNPDSETRITQLAKDINDFLSKTKVPRVKARILANPSSGNAPLTVSLRSEQVIDPSGVLIPNTNYIWWIKNGDGTRTVLGTGPSIVKTFKEERTYTVNLDIVSASRNQKGKTDVLPYSSSIPVNVLPKIGTVYMYINGINVSDIDRFKITPTVGRAGIIIDATASQAMGGSSFIKTTWSFGNGNAYANDLGPRIEKQYYSNEGIYKIKLKLTTNEGKEIVKDMDLEVRDPIASIRANKLSGFVGDEFKLSSYSAFISTKLNYDWKIIDLSNDETLFTSNLENISYKFRRTGKFSVRLKSRAPSGKEDTDTRVITIETRDPVGSMETRQTSSELPNYYLLDATQSYDPDTFDNSKLRFSWFIDGEKVDLENSTRIGARGYYTFNTLGTHKIVLEVSNQDGKTVSVKRDISVDSLLSIKLNFVPKIVKIGNPVLFLADSKEANTFEWNFGDSDTQVTNNGRISHIYKKSGNYSVTLTVKGENNKSNSITRKVYVTYGDTPFAYINIKSDNQDYLPTPNACDGNETYIIDRSKIITLTGEESINTDGNTSGLDYSWRYMNKNSNQKSFTYKFDELGCFPVSLTVKSQKTGKIHKNTVYIKVENLPPRISGLTVSAANLDSDPVVVKVSANNPIDEDGVIVSYLWYYYTDTDSEPQDFRITKAPSTTFVLPKISGKYYFVLIAEDSNGAKVNTDELSDQRYSISLSGDNINTPLVKLIVDKTNISIGDEINFKAEVKDILGRDISNKVEYKWDFDGDGFYDETGNTSQISHTYQKDGTFNFKVKVSYKGISNTKYQVITVKNILNPNFEYYAIGNKIILLNTTRGNYNGALWNLGDSITSSSLNSFVYDFGADKFPTSVSLKVFDNNESKEIKENVRRDVLNKSKIEKSKDSLIYFTYPKEEDGVLKINQGDKLFVYLGESKGEITNYCVDIDISVDSDLNGTKDDDCDNKTDDSYTKGTPFMISDFSGNSKKTMRLIVFSGKNKIDSKDIKLEITSLDKGQTEEIKENKSIPDNDKVILEEIKDLIKTVPELERVRFMQFLSLIQENWFDDREKTKTIIDFESYINSSKSIEQNTKDQFYNLLENLLVKQDQEKDEIKLAAKVLKSLIPKSNKSYETIMKNIDEILSHPLNTQINKELGKVILDAIKDDSNISNKDKLIIKSQIETIIYGGSKNVPQTAVTTEENQDGSSVLGFIVGFLKLFGYLILGFFGLIGGLFIYFKTVNKNETLSFQDFLIERFLGEKKEENNIIKKEDILGNMNKDEFENISAVSEESSIEEKPSITTEEKEEINETISPTQEVDSGIPSWLKQIEENPVEENVLTENPVQDIETKEELESLESIDTKEAEYRDEENIIEDTIEKEENKEPLEELSNNGLPDWLKGLNQEELKEEIKGELEEKENNEVVEDSVKAEEKETTEDSSPSDNGLPDWLKGSISNEENNKDSNIDDTFISQEEKETIKEISPSDNGLPDWLKGSNQKEQKSEKKEEKKDEIIKKDNKSFEKKDRKDNQDKKEFNKKQDRQSQSGNNSNKSPAKKLKDKKDDIVPKKTDDLPEWLK